MHALQILIQPYQLSLQSKSLIPRSKFESDKPEARSAAGKRSSVRVTYPAPVSRKSYPVSRIRRFVCLAPGTNKPHTQVPP